MRKQFEEIALEIDGQVVNAKVRHRQRRERGKTRDVARAQAREFKRDREYA